MTAAPRSRPVPAHPCSATRAPAELPPRPAARCFSLALTAIALIHSVPPFGMRVRQPSPRLAPRAGACGRAGGRPPPGAAAGRGGGSHAERRDRKREVAPRLTRRDRRAAPRRRTPRPSTCPPPPTSRGRPPGATRQARAPTRGPPRDTEPAALAYLRVAADVGFRQARRPGNVTPPPRGTAQRPRPASGSSPPNGKRRPRGGGARPGRGPVASSLRAAG